LIENNDLLERLAGDERLGLTHEQIARILGDAEPLTGDAQRQVEAFSARVAEWSAKYPDAAKMEPGEIL
jgi:adenylosuccinate lyase